MRVRRDWLDGLLGLTKRREPAHGRISVEKGEGGSTSVANGSGPGKSDG